MGLFDWLGNRRADNRSRLPDIRDDVRDSGSIFVFGRSQSGENVDEKSALQIATVYACVRLLAETIASLPLHLYRYTENGKEKATDHPLYKILYRQPNPEMTSFTFRETTLTHLLLWGNSYSQIIRDGKNNVLGLYPLPPENVELDRAENGELVYIFHRLTNEVPGDKENDVYLRRDEILHIPGLGFNGLVGFSPIAMMKNPLGSTLAVEKYGNAFFRHGGQPSGVLEHPGTLKNPERIRQNWMDTYGGASNAHSIAVLEEGMSYKPISLPPEDSQFLSTREFGVEEICRIFRVPPHMVQDLKRSTFNNIEHMGIYFVQYTLMPWLTRFEQSIIKDVLVGDDQDNYFPKFNVDGLMRGDYKSRMDGYAVGFQNGFMSPNDIRRLENMDPIPAEDGGDDYYLNGSYGRLRSAGAAYGANQEAQHQQQSEESEETEEEEPDVEKESKNHAARHEERKAQRKSQTAQKRR